MNDDKQRVYELLELVDAQKKKLKKLGKRVEIAHRQRVKSIPTITLIKVIIKRQWQNLSSRLR